MTVEAFPTNMPQIRYIAFTPDDGGGFGIKLNTAEVKYGPVPLGFAQFETLQAGSCTSELYYYLTREEGKASRFQLDSSDEAKKAHYLARNLEAGIDQNPDNLHVFQELLMRSMFHEGFGIIKESNPNVDRPKIPVQKYVPHTDEQGNVSFKKEIIETNFQDDLEAGRMAVRTPAHICDKHSRADNINPETGWPFQCHRKEEEGHTNKGTIGHTEFVGAAVEGDLQVPLDTLIPVPKAVQEFVEQDIENRATLLTAIEPLGCVFDAFGTMLQKGEIPESIVIIGDGPNALNTVAFCQVFAPNANVVVVGKHEEKLECFKSINPDKVTIMTTDGKDYSQLKETLTTMNGKGQADIVMPTVTLPEETISEFVADNGTLIWWAASVSEVTKGPKNAKRYNERFPYGGAPRSELSAMALMEYFIKEKPEVIEALVTYPGVYYTMMGEDAAADIEEWLKTKGRLIREKITAKGPVKMSMKPIINTQRLRDLAASKKAATPEQMVPEQFAEQFIPKPSEE